jgi:hypothetical protein
MKLACVVQRYGPAITGGSESQCRDVATRLAAHHEVHVLTSCARDYVTWRNALPAGWSSDGPMRVGRFRVARPRDLLAFREVSDRAFDRRRTTADQEEWFRANGPEVPDLFAYLEAHGHEYDFVLFWAFRYYQSYFGVPLVADRAVLVPTAEEDQVLQFPVLREFFRRPRGFLFMTPEERALVADRAGADLAPGVIVGTGLEPPKAGDATALDGLDAARPVRRLPGTRGPQQGL